MEACLTRWKASAPVRKTNGILYLWLPTLGYINVLIYSYLLRSFVDIQQYTALFKALLSKYNPTKWRGSSSFSQTWLGQCLGLYQNHHRTTTSHLYCKGMYVCMHACMGNAAKKICKAWIIFPITLTIWQGAGRLPTKWPLKWALRPFRVVHATKWLGCFLQNDP